MRIPVIVVVAVLIVVAYAFYVTGGDTSGGTIWANIVSLVKQVSALIESFFTWANNLLVSVTGISLAGVGEWIAKIITKLWDLLVTAVGAVASKFAL